MTILWIILITLFNIFYCLTNYLFSINFVITFFVVELLSLLIIRKSKFVFNIKYCVISFFASLLCLIIFPNNLMHGYENNKINIRNDNNLYYSLYYDDEKQVIDRNTDKIVTDYNYLNKITSEYITGKSNMSFDSKKSHKIILQVEKEEKRKTILINNNEKIISAKKQYEYNFVEKLNHYYEYIEINNLRSFDVLLMFISFIYLFIMFYNALLSRKLFMIISLIIMEFSGVVNLGIISKILLCGITLLPLKYKENKISILEIICSCLVTFCFIGNLIIDNVSFNKIIYFILIVYLISILISILFNIIFKIKLKKVSYQKRHKYILFFIIFLTLLLYKICIGSTFIHPDGIMQLHEINTNNLSNWHPFMHTLFIKYSNMLLGNDGFIYIRILVISFMMTYILNTLYKMNFKIKYCYIITIIFLLNPVNIIYIMSLIKDVDFSICLIFITFLLFYFIKNKKIELINIILYIIMLAGILYFRHNGIIAYIGLSLILIYLLVKFNYKLKKIIIISFCMLSLLPIRMVLINILDVNDNVYNFKFATISHGLDSLYYHNLLDDNDKNYLNTIMEERRWLEGYNKYDIDVLIHHNLGNYLLQDIDGYRLFMMYLKNMFKHPIYLINDRLYGSDILWNVFGSDYHTNYRYHLIYDAYDYNYANADVNYVDNNNITHIGHKLLLILGSNKILDALFFRGGIYLAISIILIFYILKEKINCGIILFLPMIFNNLSLFLTMHNQSFRYVLYMPILTIMCIVYVLMLKKDKLML